MVAGLVTVSCKKDKTDPTPKTTNTVCSIDTSLVPDVQWHHLTGVLADLKFSSDGTYYENTTNDGHWVFSNGCDSIYVTRPSNNFYYKIKSVSTDTLKIVNQVFGELTYYK